jgi:riboflavin transporter FmnP
MEKNNHRLTQRLRWLTLVGMMSALTYILYLPIFRIPIILFLQLNFSEVVIFIGGFSLGPLAAIFIGLFRFLFSLFYTSTGGIGELADYLYSMAFVLPGVILYQWSRDKKLPPLDLSSGLSVS